MNDNWNHKQRNEEKGSHGVLKIALGKKNYIPPLKLTMTIPFFITIVRLSPNLLLLEQQIFVLPSYLVQGNNVSLTRFYKHES